MDTGRGANWAVRGRTADVIGDIAAGHGVRLHQRSLSVASLESSYREFTRDSVEYAAAKGRRSSAEGCSQRAFAFVAVSIILAYLNLAPQRRRCSAG